MVVNAASKLLGNISSANVLQIGCDSENTEMSIWMSLSITHSCA